MAFPSWPISPPKPPPACCRWAAFPQPGADQPGAECGHGRRYCVCRFLADRADDRVDGLPDRQDDPRAGAHCAGAVLAAAHAGAGLVEAPFSAAAAAQGIDRFPLSTNFSGTINMVARDSEVLWVGYFFSPLEAGYYKTALAIINLVVMPITPFISTTYPEITRAVAAIQLGAPAPPAAPGDA